MYHLPNYARGLAIFCISFVISVTSYSQTTSAGNGDWNDPTTWVGGTVPTSGDVIIATGHTVIYNANHNTSNAVTISSLDVQGTGALVWPFSDDAAYDAVFTLTVTGAVTTAASASITTRQGDSGTTLAGLATDRTHQFNIGGNVTNAGTFTLLHDNAGTDDVGKIVNLDFTNTLQLSGAGTYTTYNIDIQTGNTVTFNDITINICSDDDNSGDLDLQGGVGNGSTLIVTGASADVNIYHQVDVLQESKFQVDNGTVDAGLNNVTANQIFDLSQDAELEINAGNMTIGPDLTSVGNDMLRLIGSGCIVDVNGGNLTVGNTTSGEGEMITNAATTTGTVDINSGTFTVADNITFNAASGVTFSVSNSGTLNIATGNVGVEDNTTFLAANTLTVDGAGSSANFGENIVYNAGVPTLTNGCTLTIGSNDSEAGNFALTGVWTIDNSITVNFDAGVNITGVSDSLKVESTGTVSVVRNRTSITGVEMTINGVLQVDGGTFEAGGGLINSGTMTQDLIRIANGGDFVILDGTVNLLNNVGFTDPTIMENDQAIDLTGGLDGTGNLIVGDSVGAASSAALNIATNLASIGSPANEWLVQVNADDGRFDINSDGFVQIGSGNTGGLLIQEDNNTPDEDYHVTVEGGTLDVYGAMNIDDGAGFRMIGGTTRVGFTSNGGFYDVNFPANPNFQTIFEITGGTMTVGDGAALTVIGNNNNNPAHGTAGEYVEFEVTGGTLNYNGQLRMRDQNARLILGGNATINFNPRAINNLDEASDILFLENGIVDIQGPVNINFLNPHVLTGAGHAIEIQGIGAGNNLITSSFSAGVGAAIDFSNVTWGFGDGSESETGADGFDLDLATGHTSYGSFVVNNPTGNGRTVNFSNTGNSYPTESITITAGEFDLGTNDLDDDGDGSTTFSVAANGTLSLDTDFPGQATAYTTYTLSTGSTVNFNGSATINNPVVPSGIDFSNVVIAGSTVVPGAAMVIIDTLTLTSGTFTGGTNVVIGNGASSPLIEVNSATRTGTIQGTNAYDVRYVGTSKSIDPSSDFEWSGGGSKGLNINLDASEVLTVTTQALSVVDLSITQGSLTDAALNHTVTGDLTNNTSYTGTGSIQMTGASEQTLSSSGTATFSNLTINNSSSTGAVGDLDVNITGTLTLTDGLLNVTSGSVTIASGGSISGGSAASYIAFNGNNAAGGLIQTFTAVGTLNYPFGTATEYTPGTVNVNSATGLGALTITPVNSPSNFTLDASNTLDLDYHWILTEDGNFADVVVDYTFVYDDTDIRGVEGSYISARYNVASPAWTTSDDTPDGADGVTPGTNTLSFNDVDFISGQITAGELDEFNGTIVTFYPIANGDWDDGTNWTNIDGSGTPINRVPGTNSPVVVNKTVTIDVDGQSAGSINIDGDNSGILVVTDNLSGSPSSGHTLGTVTGNGILRLSSADTDSPVFPDENGANWSTFLSASGGTVVYTGDGSYTLPGDVSTYHNLEITSASTTSIKTLGNADVSISGNLTVTGANTTIVQLSDAASGNLTITGNIDIANTNTLRFQGTTARTISVDSVSVAGTFDVVGTGSATHGLTIGGTLTSTGTFDMNTGGSVVDATFTGAASEQVTGAGSVDFNRLILNKGTSQASQLEIDATTFTVSGTGATSGEPSLDLQNGTLILSTGGTITLGTNGDVTIAATAKLDMNSSIGTVQMTGSSVGNLILNGALEISTGVLNIGNETNQSTVNNIQYGNGAEIIVNGGVLNVGGAIRPNVDDASAGLTFNLSSGTVSVARNTVTNNQAANNNLNRNDADFAMNSSSSSFTISGGTLEVVRPLATDGKAISLHSNISHSVTGGTVEIGVNAHDAFSSVSTATGQDIAIYSAVPLWNLVAGDGNMNGDIGGSTTAQDLTILNDITINTNGLFRFTRASNGGQNGYNINVGGSFTVTAGSIGIENDGTGGTLTFNGSGLSGQTSPQVFTSSGETFGDIVINNTNGSGAVNLSGNLAVEGNWTYIAGTFTPGGATVTMDNSNGFTTSITGDASFDNLTLNNKDTVRLAGNVTISSTGTLTLGDSVILDLQQNNLTIDNPTASAITFSGAGGADETNMIIADGTTASTGLTRSYPASTTSGFIFPVGNEVNGTFYYTPAQVDMAANSAVGTVTIVPIAAQHPQAVDASTALNYYWTVSGTGFSGEQVTYTFTYGSDATDIVEGGSDASFIGAYYQGTPTFAWTESIGTVNTTNNDLTYTSGTTLISADFTAGLDAAFEAVTVFYAFRTGDWNNTSTGTTPWSNTNCAGGEVLGVQPGADDPCIVCSGATLTVTTATGLSASAISIESTGTLISQIDDISVIGDIDGTGTLQFNTSSGVTPAFGNLSATFIAASGGTVDYSGSTGYTLPSLPTYNNIEISNTGTITLANDLSINGNVDINSGGTTDLGGFTITDLDNGGTFTLGANTTLEVDAQTNFPANFNTYAFDATSTTEYVLGGTATTQTVQGGITYGNLLFTRTSGDPNPKALNGNIVVVGDLTISRRAELQAGTHNIEVQGNWTMDTRNNTNFDPGTGTVTFSGGNAQTVSFTNGTETETFYNLIINKSANDVSFPSGISAINVDNDLTITDGTLAMAAIPLTVTGNTSTAAGGSLTSTTAIDLNGNLTNTGTTTVSNNINLAGDFNNTGTYTTTSNTLIFDNVSTGQSISGNSTTFNNLQVVKATDVDLTINTPITIAGTLALNNEGNVVLSGTTNNLTISETATVTGNSGGSTSADFSAERSIQTDGSGTASTVIKIADNADQWDFFFPLGVDNSGTDLYTPVTIGATDAGTNVGADSDIELRSVTGTSTSQAISGSATTINRHYDLIITGLTGSVTFDLIFQYDDADIQGAEGDYNAAYSIGGGWLQPVASMPNVSAVNNQFGASASLDGTIDFGTSPITSEWIAGDNDLLFPRYYTRAGGVDCGSITCDWTDGTNWTFSDGGTTSAGSTPGANNAVTISTGHTMAMIGNSNSSASIDILGTLDIASTTGHSLGEVTGTGTMQLSTATFPTFDTGSGTTFFGSSGGTVIYDGAAYTLPAGINEYNNLIIQGSGDKDLGVSTTVLGATNINSINLTNTSDFDLELQGGLSFSSGGLNINNGSLTFSNASAANIGSDITFGATATLILDNIGTKNLLGNLTLSNLSFTASSGNLDADDGGGPYSINLSGNWRNNAASNLFVDAGTVTFNGTTAQQIDGINVFETVVVSNSSATVTVNSGTQTINTALTLNASSTLDLGTSTIRSTGNDILDVNLGTFTAPNGTVVYAGTTNGEVQTDPISVGTLEIDKSGSNTFDNDPATVTFSSLVISSGEYDGPDADLTLSGDFNLGASGTFNLTGVNNIDVNSFSNGATLDLSGLTTLTIGGDFSNTGTFTAPTNIVFDGASTQNLNNVLSASNLTKSGGGHLVLNDDLDVSNVLTLTSGNIMSSLTNLLTLGTAATISGGSVSSHVDSVMAHTLATAVQTTKTFPLGDSLNYRPIEFDLTQTNATTRVYTAQLSAGAPTARTIPVDLNHVTGIRHYNVTQTPNDGLSSSPGDNVVRFDFGPDDDVLDTVNLQIVKDDGAGSWINLGGAVTGSASSGSIASENDFSAFSDFALASTTQEASLPVELIYFDGAHENGEVTLHWATATEINNERFDIERSIDGLNFELIGVVNGQGNSDDVHTYEFKDLRPYNEINYYRLIQYDFDGTSEASKTIYVTVSTAIQTISVYPNPASDQISVLSNFNLTSGYYKLVDLQGRMLEQGDFKGNSNLDISVKDLTTGIYELIITTPFGTSITKVVRE